MHGWDCRQYIAELMELIEELGNTKGNQTAEKGGLGYAKSETAAGAAAAAM